MKTSTRQITLIALFLALCVIVPFLFHLIGAGALFLPMFIPILLAGFIIEFPLAMLVGMLGPWCSALITGMPPLFPTALFMSVEGMTAAGVVSYLFHNKKWSIWLCLILGILFERFSLVIMGIIIAPLLKLPPEFFSIYKLIESLPGVILQLVLIPTILKLLLKDHIFKQKT